MKKLLPLLLCFVFNFSAHSQDKYWQQSVDYNIKVSLDDADNSIEGNISMHYLNNSPDTLHYIWIHLWPNAYKNDRTAFSEQMLENGSTKFYFSADNQKGYINRLAFKLDGSAAETTDHPQEQDILKLILNQPLVPGGSVNIETDFHVKLPLNFSRGGHIGQSYQLTQWYPKPAVYDKDGWHEMPYLDQGEFYSEFGSYKVAITLPEAYKVASTGVLQNETQSGNKKTLLYQQESIHDFAWFADKEFEINHDSILLGNRIVDLFIYHYPAHNATWAKSMDFLKAAVTTKSQWVGEYPYNVVSVVENPGNNTGGGMEYPTITLIENPSTAEELNELINHEVGHNWFYGILASNERLHPWMDEGMNSYYDQRYKLMSPVNSDKASKHSMDKLPPDFDYLLLQTLVGMKKDQPIETPSEKFIVLNYSSVAYTKTSLWMKLLEERLGTSLFDSCMRAYYTEWKFKHPAPQDFERSFEQASGQNLEKEFSLLKKTGELKASPKKDIRLTGFFNLKDTDKHHYISILPAAGINFYDKLMVGAMIHNYSLPVPKLTFFAAPLYSTAAKERNGIGRIGYTWYGNKGQQLELSGSYARFNGDSFKDSTGTVNYQPFRKIVPSLKYVFGKNDPRSHTLAYIQWKTFLISETGLSFNRDTINLVDVISYPVYKRTVNQLKVGLENNRVLYPYDALLQVDQGKGFVRAGFTANYFFNYVSGGGMNLRFFAGKFFYTGDKTYLTSFETDPYHLTLSGASGYEDYTYSNYFYGRGEFEGFASQQIMIRDGGFKVRTDLLNAKVGKTDDWLSAVNFTSDIPAQVNPFSVLPFKLPVKFFIDAGTYAEAWKKDAGTGRFLYDAGLQLSLFRNILNVYFPLLYSKVYKDYFKSYIPEKRFSKNISFSIDVQNLRLQKLFPQFSF